MYFVWNQMLMRKAVKACPYNRKMSPNVNNPPAMKQEGVSA